jgi:hypothetical protein
LRHAAALVGAALCLVAAGPLPDAGGAAVGAIDRFCETLEGFARRLPARRIFALTAVGTTENGWREFADEQEVRVLAEQVRIEGTAVHADRSDGATFVWTMFATPSGDWVHYVDYCFRSDGTLARTWSRLNTAQALGGPVFRLRIRHHDAGRVLISSTGAVFDLSTEAPAPGREFLDTEEPHYASKSVLPYLAHRQ